MHSHQPARRAHGPGVLRLTPVLACLLIPPLAWGQYAPARPKFDTLSDFGGVGLLQMPSARFADEGGIAIGTSLIEPYQRTAVTLQALPWLEGTLRYTAVRNRLYGPASFSGDQNYKDRGFDVKVRLLEESRYTPQIAIGLRDVGGTGLFSGEYLVASRRFYDLDFSLGIGWGNLGTRGHIKNPLTSLSDRFKSREREVGRGGTVSTSAFFSGESVSLFGGINYQTPIPGLTLKLEYDGNDYSQEAQNNSQEVRSPFNFGAVYSYGDWLDLTVAYERGNRFMVHAALRSNLRTMSGLPKRDPAPEAIKPRKLDADIAKYLMENPPPVSPPGNPVLKMSQSLAELDYKIDSIELRGKEMIATISQPTFRNKAQAIGRAARAMANAAPQDIEQLTIVNLDNGLQTQRVSLMRQDLEKAVRYESSPEEMARNLRIAPPSASISQAEQHFENDTLYPEFNWGWEPAMRHHIGGPDSPYFYQLFMRLYGSAQINRKLSISGNITANISDNLDGLKLPSDSVLPRVRSDIKNYLKEGKSGVEMLQLDYLSDLGSNHFGRFSAGLYEEMFGGVGGEFLYKPFDQRWAIGADLYRVRQRDYDKRFSFRDYEVTTGHVDFYYMLPFYDITAQLSVGQYLAGDRGATLTLSRRFASGAEIGVFATKTNVSAEDFGEGSFDKGAFITVPFDTLSFFSSRNMLSMGWRPLTRDGGQRLHQSKRLYPLVSSNGRNALLADWSKVLD